MTGHPEDSRRRGSDGGTPSAEWPVRLRGVTESVVATLGPNDRWNHAALGLYASDRTPGSDAAVAVEGITARSWGATRTKRNFDREGGGVVQFTTDPREFVEAALSIRESADPVLPGARAWVRVRAIELAVGEDEGVQWTDWRLDPIESTVRRQCVPTINRGFNAVIEATVAASRLGVPAYDQGQLRERLDVLADVVEAAGGPAEREALARIREYSKWDGARDESSSTGTET